MNWRIDGKKKGQNSSTITWEANEVSQKTSVIAAEGGWFKNFAMTVMCEKPVRMKRGATLYLPPANL